MKTLALFTLLSISMLSGFTQNWSPPIDYVLDVAADYTEYEADVIEAANWLRDNSPTADFEKYKKTSIFVIDWVNGSPTVTVEIMPVIIDFNKKNPNMLVLYMASCAKYVLENEDPNNIKAKHKAALKDMVDAYQNQSTMSKDKKMEKLVTAFEEGTIDTWIEKNMSIE